MRKEKLIKELQKTREKKQAIIKKEQELEHDLREAEKAEVAAIVESFHITSEELREMLLEHQAENQKILEQEEKKENDRVDLLIDLHS